MTAPSDPDLRVVGPGALPPLESKLLGAEDLLARFGRPRAGRLVFTNGVFDILHRGHVEYLDAARRLGDHLVVAVNSDASAARQGKGRDRPLVPLQDRMRVLAGLAAVDLVVPFEEDTPHALISALLPDILVKGGDYCPGEIVGGAEVEAAGGEVRVLPFLEGRSTTGLVERIREGAPPSSPSAPPTAPPSSPSSGSSRS